VALQTSGGAAGLLVIHDTPSNSFGLSRQVADMTDQVSLNRIAAGRCGIDMVPLVS
jgi:hypothetical protein